MQAQINKDVEQQHASILARIGSCEDQISQCRNKREAEEGQYKSNIATIEHTLTITSDENSPEAIARKIAMFSDLQRGLSKYSLANISTSRKMEQDLCEERNNLIRKHSLDLEIIEPTNPQLFDDFQRKSDELNEAITFRIKHLMMLSQNMESQRKSHQILTDELDSQMKTISFQVHEMQ
jgi:hypothetical protein